MSIALVLNDKNIISPIVEGVTLRILNAEIGEQVDFRNPALDLEEGRRGATLRFAIEHGATIFVAPPETFCELSYQKAQSENIQFYHVKKSTSYEQFQGLLSNQELEITKDLPIDEVVPSVPNK